MASGFYIFQEPLQREAQRRAQEQEAKRGANAPLEHTRPPGKPGAEQLGAAQGTGPAKMPAVRQTSVLPEASQRLQRQPD